MEPSDNVNRPPTDQGEKNPNPPQPPNLKIKIEWIGGSWYLMHLPATIGRCPA